MPKVYCWSLPGASTPRLFCLLFSLLLWYTSAAQIPYVLPDSVNQSQIILVDSVQVNNVNSAASKQISPVWKAAGLATLGAGTWIATYAFVDEPLQKFSQANRTDYTKGVATMVEPMGRPKYLMPLAGAALASGVLFNDEKLQKVGMLTAGSLLVNSFFTSNLKKSFSRYRPSISSENNLYGDSEQGGNTSLPSAHTSTAFTVATSIALVYGQEYKFVPPLAYGLATLVGLSRIHDNVHWATDVMAGAIVGYLSAKATNHLYELAAQKLQLKRHILLVAPQVSTNAFGLTAVITLPHGKD